VYIKLLGAALGLGFSVEALPPLGLLQKLSPFNGDEQEHMLKSLDHIIGALENQLPLQGPQQFQRLLKCWPEIVGAAVANQTRPYSISRDVLYVATSSSVWAQELKFKRHFLLKKLNAQLSSRLIDIRFSTAGWQKDSSQGNWASPSSSTLWQEHPSCVVQAASVSPIDEAVKQNDSRSAFQRWAQVMQARSLSLPLCPQCHCPTPSGELQRWSVCGLCATKQWKG
jgi:predicted nucleic acid-binding Zn ribbon protein